MSDTPSSRRPLALAGSCILLVIGVLGTVIQGARLALGHMTYESSVVSVIGSLMIATMGGMALGVLLRRR